MSLGGSKIEFLLITTSVHTGAIAPVYTHFLNYE